MAILEVEWCDFVVYSNGCVIVDRILADLDYWYNLSEKLEEVCYTCNTRHSIQEDLHGRAWNNHLDNQYITFCAILLLYACSYSQ